MTIVMDRPMSKMKKCMKTRRLGLASNRKETRMNIRTMPMGMKRAIKMKEMKSVVMRTMMTRKKTAE